VSRTTIGARAERAAAAALAARGYRVLATNVRARGGEIDIVCRDGETFVFCEVKARRAGGAYPADETVTFAKRRRLERLAATHLAHIGRRDAAYRLELVAIDLDERDLPARLRVLPFG